jgi:hypothetical protein
MARLAFEVLGLTRREAVALIFTLDEECRSCYRKTMTVPTAYVQIERITRNRRETMFVGGYAWDTDELTRLAYRDARRRFSVPLEHADYLVDLFSEPGEMVDTFPMVELGYRTLTRHRVAA